MFKPKNVLFLVLSALLIACRPFDPDEPIRRAVSLQLEHYPQSTLQDIYKSFAQAQFGAGHLVPDTAVAAQYLTNELSIADQSPILYEPIGVDSAYYRVHLCAVQQGYISRDALFAAFLASARPVSESEIAAWADRWAHIQSVIAAMDLDLPRFDTDSAMIAEALREGHYAFHHSLEFNISYSPHYRIVRRDIFESCLLHDLQ